MSPARGHSRILLSVPEQPGGLDQAIGMADAIVHPIRITRNCKMVTSPGKVPGRTGIVFRIRFPGALRLSGLH